MPKIVVSAEVESRITRHADPDDIWDAGDTAGEVSNVEAFIDRHDGRYYGESVARELDVKIGDTVYAVVADYESGSTFGRSGGHATVLDVFTTLLEAEGLLEAAQAPPASDDYSDRYSFTHNGVDYHRSWVGHFESLNSLDIWDIQVKQNPHDPIKKGPGRYSLKRGH
jgi:hypothetical protein